eukprot:Rmarinus@m.14023
MSRVGCQSRVTAFFFFFLLVCQCTVISADTWLYLDFSEGSGSTLFDSSGNGFDCAISGATWQTTGCMNDGTCLYFDGNDYVTIPTDVFSDLPNSFPYELKISFWMKADPSCDTDFGNVLNGDSISISHDYTYDFLRFNAGGVVVQTKYSCAEVADWHYYTFFADGVYGMLYRDGEFVFYDDQSVTIDIPTSISIGSSYRGFKGWIDEFSISKGTLEEDLADYNAFGYEAPPTFTSPSLYLDLAEGSGSVAQDFSGNSFDANVTGGVWETTACYNDGICLFASDRPVEEGLTETETVLPNVTNCTVLNGTMSGCTVDSCSSAGDDGVLSSCVLYTCAAAAVTSNSTSNS